MVAYTKVQFVEDEGDVLFYKNSRGLAQRVAIEEECNASDSGVAMDDK